jgi:hypothetical protein
MGGNSKGGKMFYEAERKFDGQNILINLDKVSVISRILSSNDCVSHTKVEFNASQYTENDSSVDLMLEEYDKIRIYLINTELITLVVEKQKHKA